MKYLMAKGYDEEIDLYYKDITNHYHYKYFSHIQPLGHENLQNFMLCIYHDKDAPTATPLAPCQANHEKNLEKCIHGNLQMRPQLLHLKY